MAALVPFMRQAITSGGVPTLDDGEHLRHERRLIGRFRQAIG
jgi:hypothetical protein